MAATGFALFDTAIGACGIAWGPHGLVGGQLPEGTDARTRARLQRRFPGVPETPPPAEVRQACDAIRRLLDGQPIDLAEIALDLEGIDDFRRRVYAVTRRIPPGRTRSYGEIAAELGDPLLARDVGRALGLNPFPPVVPCHRVLAAGGRPGGFSAHGGAQAKLRMLAIENARPESESGDLF